MKTEPVKKTDISRDWYIFDGKGKILGRLATQIATLLIGKNKSNFVYNLDCGDWVVVVNCEKINLTGKKESSKVYQHHTGWPGGLKEVSYKKMMEKDPARVLSMAVSGMLPKNKLRAARLKRLRIFVGNNHDYKGKELIEVK
jgi:large subunit ribosomal protein L13